MWTYSPSSVNSTISGIISFTRPCVSPSDTPDSMMFSMPVASGFSPSDSENSVDTRPRDSAVPRVGKYIPAITRSMVLFPAPFRPISPTCSWRAISTLTSSSAVTVARPSEKFSRPPTLACIGARPFHDGRLTRPYVGSSIVRSRSLIAKSSPIPISAVSDRRSLPSFPRRREPIPLRTGAVGAYIHRVSRRRRGLYVAANAARPAALIDATTAHDTSVAVSPVRGARTSSR